MGGAVLGVSIALATVFHWLPPTLCSFPYQATEPVSRMGAELSASPVGVVTVRNPSARAAVETA